MSYTAFVPARSGSKRLPNKNVKLLGGRPLVVWTLEACAQAQKTTAVIFSTDSKEYWNLAKEHVRSDKLVLDYRDPEEAGDTVKIFDYVKEKRSKIFQGRSGAFILTLPTVPLRRAHHIDEAIALFEKDRQPVFSATSYGFPISFAFTMESDGRWASVFPESPMVTGNTRSQNQRETFHPNGAIYVRAIEDLDHPELKTFYDGARPYFMDRTASVDIDKDVDFRIADALI